MHTVTSTVKNTSPGRSPSFKEDSVKARLKTMLVAKNLELAGCYHREPMSYPALLTWCEEQAELFGPYIADTGEYLEQAVSEGKRWYWKPSLEP